MLSVSAWSENVQTEAEPQQHCPAHLGPNDGAVDAVVADFDGDLSVRQVRPDKGGLDFNTGLFLGVQYVPERKEDARMNLPM